jgi:hypothetical protein
MIRWAHPLACTEAACLGSRTALPFEPVALSQTAKRAETIIADDLSREQDDRR